MLIAIERNLIIDPKQPSSTAAVGNDDDGGVVISIRHDGVLMQAILSPAEAEGFCVQGIQRAAAARVVLAQKAARAQGRVT